MNKVVIVDGNNIAYAAYYSYSNLSHKGEPVGTLYGIISMIRGYIGEHNPTKLIVVWDSARDINRLKILPEYKGTRKAKQDKKLFDRESFNKQKDKAIQILSNLGIRQVKVEGREADDLIYELTRKYKKENLVVIVSADKDFLQLISKNVRIWNPLKRALIHTKNILKYFPVSQDKVVDYLCLSGDSSDNIPKYPGVGEKTALKFFDVFGSITSYLQSKELSTFKIDKKKLLELYKRNRELIDLKYFYKLHYKGKSKIQFLKRKYDEAKFLKECSKYAFYSFNNIKYLKTFKNLYDGKDS